MSVQECATTTVSCRDLRVIHGTLLEVRNLLANRLLPRIDPVYLRSEQERAPSPLLRICETCLDETMAPFSSGWQQCAHGAFCVWCGPCPECAEESQ